MNDRFIYLMEKYFSGELTLDEGKEFQFAVQNNADLKKEFEEQLNMHEVLSKMKIKDPLPEAWDNYWLGIYNRLERKIGWILFSLGVLILLGFGSYSFVDEFLLKDSEAHLVIKIGVTSFLFGILVLIFSVAREKFFASKTDKYKEIQR